MIPKMKSKIFCIVIFLLMYKSLCSYVFITIHLILNFITIIEDISNLLHYFLYLEVCQTYWFIFKFFELMKFLSTFIIMIY